MCTTSIATHMLGEAFTGALAEKHTGIKVQMVDGMYAKVDDKTVQLPHIHFRFTDHNGLSKAEQVDKLVDEFVERNPGAARVYLTAVWGHEYPNYTEFTARIGAFPAEGATPTVPATALRC